MGVEFRESSSIRGIGCCGAQNGFGGCLFGGFRSVPSVSRNGTLGMRKAGSSQWLVAVRLCLSGVSISDGEAEPVWSARAINVTVAIISDCALAQRRRFNFRE